VSDYFTLLATAHECIVQKPKGVEDVLPRNFNYVGPSPDEITLVDCAKHMGFIFIGSASSRIDLIIHNERKSVELCKIFEFDSNRKRMSIVIKEDGVYKLYVKGADNIIK
jgi:magnesium-transporting ATPase (P-type)